MSALFLACWLYLAIHAEVGSAMADKPVAEVQS